MPAEPLLQVEHLTKHYGQLVAVDDVSFALAAGGSLAIVGESGSGKTTIARILTGLIDATAGRVSFAGADRSKRARSRKDRLSRAREIQIVFQDPSQSLDRRQTIADGLLELLRLHKPEWDKPGRWDRVQQLADLVHLDERHLRALPANLSGGQRQRVAIARALAAEPRIVLLDEAVAALDVSIQAQILNLLADIRDATGVSYILISHDLSVVRQLCDDVVVMKEGRIVERGAAEEILDRPTHEYTQRLRASVPRPGWKPTLNGGAEAPQAVPAAD